MDFDVGLKDVGFAVLQELWNRVAKQAVELSAETRDVMFEKNSFQEFSRNISQLNILLRALDAKKIEAAIGVQLTEMALDTLSTQLQRGRRIVQNCKSRSRLRVLLHSGSVLQQMQVLSKEIAVTISSFQLMNLGISSNLKSMNKGIIHGLRSTEFRSSIATETIMAEIERSMTEDRKDRDNSMKLLERIAEAVGSTSGGNMALIREELAILKREKEEMEAQKKEAEALQLSQLIQLLYSTELVASPPSANENANIAPRNYLVDSFVCPLSKKMMREPVAILCGHSFERRAIEEHFEKGERTCPTCKEELESIDVTPNLTLRGSLEEWRRRDRDLRFESAVHAIDSDDCSQQNRALEDLQSLMETPSYTTRIVQENLIWKFVNFLKDDSLNTTAALRCLNCLARHSEDSKEAIAEAGGLRLIIKRLYKGETEVDALGVLLELSTKEAVAEKIGSTKSCIPRLISMLNHSTEDVKEKAQELLQNLSFNTHFVVKMAESGHFHPFVARFNQGPQETRALMAAALFQMPLKENGVLELKNEQFMHNLVQMLSSNSPASKAASLKTTKKLMAYPELVKLLVADPATIPLILGVILYGKSDPHLKESVEILALLVGSSENSDFQVFQGLKELQSEHNVGLFLQLVFSSDLQTKIPFLKLLVELGRKSDAARDLMRSNDNFIIHLFSCLSSDQKGNIRVWAMKLIHSISEGHNNGVPLPISPGKETTVNTLASILANSPLVEERSIAAAIISELPKDDPVIDEILCRSETLKAIFEVICAMDMESDHIGMEPCQGTTLLEDALAALLRYTEPTKPELGRQVGKLKMYPSLVRVLSTGSSLAKQRTAIALAQLSQSTGPSVSLEPVETSSSFQFSPLTSLLGRISGCCLASSEIDYSCPVHGIACSPRDTFCLVKSDAVKPLVRSLSETESGVQEAALMALETLLADPITRSRATSTIIDSQGVAAIFQVLEKGPLPAKSKALDLLEKILSPGHAIDQTLFRRVEGFLIQLLHDDDLKKKAALVLRQMKLIPHQSSYF
ncbi:U-box domain-containing protein 44-like [Punica granatum]|uniref:RING-type E3 ubiquitin transferase n=1 Tax=Punica granatum TaxID=22663 RepID=A0A218WUR4_PUNGR|nr:U-box domain-containing protein 44-like [Punica granatum]OWM76269.1 hypothetical protein CDL15_Pgr009915 [Punica granatum]